MLEEIVCGRTTSRDMSNLLLPAVVPVSIVFTKHPLQLTTCFKNVIFKKGTPIKREGCLDTLDTPPLDQPLHYELI